MDRLVWLAGLIAFDPASDSMLGFEWPVFAADGQRVGGKGRRTASIDVSAATNASNQAAHETAFVAAKGFVWNFP
jgi:hypothetical protein